MNKKNSLLKTIEKENKNVKLDDFVIDKNFKDKIFIRAYLLTKFKKFWKPTFIIWSYDKINDFLNEKIELIWDDTLYVSNWYIVIDIKKISEKLNLNTEESKKFIENFITKKIKELNLWSLKQVFELLKNEWYNPYYFFDEITLDYDSIIWDLKFNNEMDFLTFSYFNKNNFNIDNIFSYNELIKLHKNIFNNSFEYNLNINKKSLIDNFIKNAKEFYNTNFNKAINFILNNYFNNCNVYYLKNLKEFKKSKNKIISNLIYFKKEILNVNKFLKKKENKKNKKIKNKIKIILFKFLKEEYKKFLKKIYENKEIKKILNFINKINKSIFTDENNLIAKKIIFEYLFNNINDFNYKLINFEEHLKQIKLILETYNFLILDRIIISKQLPKNFNIWIKNFQVTFKINHYLINDINVIKLRDKLIWDIYDKALTRPWQLKVYRVWKSAIREINIFWNFFKSNLIQINFSNTNSTTKLYYSYDLNLNSNKINNYLSKKERSLIKTILKQNKLNIQNNNWYILEMIKTIKSWKKFTNKKMINNIYKKNKIKINLNKNYIAHLSAIELKKLSQFFLISINLYVFRWIFNQINQNILFSIFNEKDWKNIINFSLKSKLFKKINSEKYTNLIKKYSKINPLHKEIITNKKLKSKKINLNKFLEKFKINNIKYLKDVNRINEIIWFNKQDIINTQLLLLKNNPYLKNILPFDEIDNKLLQNLNNTNFLKNYWIYSLTYMWLLDFFNKEFFNKNFLKTYNLNLNFLNFSEKNIFHKESSLFLLSKNNKKVKLSKQNFKQLFNVISKSNHLFSIKNKCLDILKEAYKNYVKKYNHINFLIQEKENYLLYHKIYLLNLTNLKKEFLKNNLKHKTNENFKLIDKINIKTIKLENEITQKYNFFHIEILKDNFIFANQTITLNQIEKLIKINKKKIQKLNSELISLKDKFKKIKKFDEFIIQEINYLINRNKKDWKNELIKNAFKHYFNKINWETKFAIKYFIKNLNNKEIKKRFWMWKLSTYNYYNEIFNSDFNFIFNKNLSKLNQLIKLSLIKFNENTTFYNLTFKNNSSNNNYELFKSILNNDTTDLTDDFYNEKIMPFLFNILKNFELNEIEYKIIYKNIINTLENSTINSLEKILNNENNFDNLKNIKILKYKIEKLTKKINSIKKTNKKLNLNNEKSIKKFLNNEIIKEFLKISYAINLKLNNKNFKQWIYTLIYTIKYDLFSLNLINNKNYTFDQYKNKNTKNLIELKIKSINKFNKEKKENNNNKIKIENNFTIESILNWIQNHIKTNAIINFKKWKRFKTILYSFYYILSYVNKYKKYKTQLLKYFYHNIEKLFPYEELNQYLEQHNLINLKWLFLYFFNFKLKTNNLNNLINK